MASTVNFSGLATSLPTDQLIQAVMDKEGAPLQRMEDRKALNARRISSLRSVNAAMLAFNTSLGNLYNSSFSARSLLSSDPNNTYVTATASGAAPGTYDVKVAAMATKAQMTDLQGVATSSSKVVEDGKTATFALLDTDGSTKTFTISGTGSNNTLTGLRDAINASGANVSATIVNTGAAGTPYKLVLNAKSTGTGSAGATTFKFADVTADGAANTLGLDTGTLTSGALTAGGRTSNGAAQDAHFYVNGVEMWRKSNTVTDAVEGLSLTLKGEGQATATTLTVSQDRSAVSNALNDVVSKFNSLLKIYKDNSGTDGTMAGDTAVRNMIERLRHELVFRADGLSSTNTFQSGAESGLKTNRDGTLSLDTTVLQKALDVSPTDLANLFTKAGANIQSTVFKITSPGSGDLAQVIRRVDDQNVRLSKQIESGQVRLDKRKAMLQALYANLESTIGKMQAAGQSLSSIA